jgi:hypothetical protein
LAPPWPNWSFSEIGQAEANNFARVSNFKKTLFIFLSSSKTQLQKTFKVPTSCVLQMTWIMGFRVFFQAIMISFRGKRKRR